MKVNCGAGRKTRAAFATSCAWYVDLCSLMLYLTIFFGALAVHSGSSGNRTLFRLREDLCCSFQLFADRAPLRIRRELSSSQQYARFSLYWPTPHRASSRAPMLLESGAVKSTGVTSLCVESYPVRRLMFSRAVADDLRRCAGCSLRLVKQHNGSPISQKWLLQLSLSRIERRCASIGSLAHLSNTFGTYHIDRPRIPQQAYRPTPHPASSRAPMAARKRCFRVN